MIFLMVEVGCSILQFYYLNLKSVFWQSCAGNVLWSRCPAVATNEDIWTDDNAFGISASTSQTFTLRSPPLKVVHMAQRPLF